MLLTFRLQNLKVVHFKEGDVVFTEGQPACAAYWFLGGNLWAWILIYEYSATVLWVVVECVYLCSY